MSIETLDKKLELLPPELQREVVDFVDFLLAKKVLPKKKKPGLNWMGGLKEYRDQYTAFELQKSAGMKWRT